MYNFAKVKYRVQLFFYRCSLKSKVWEEKNNQAKYRNLKKIAVTLYLCFVTLQLGKSCRYKGAHLIYQSVSFSSIKHSNS